MLCLQARKKLDDPKITQKKTKLTCLNMLYKPCLQARRKLDDPKITQKLN